jgi:hypothetical protein
MRAGVDQGKIIYPVLLILYVNDMPTPSRHVELALYADDTAIIAKSHQPALLVNYLETYRSDTGLETYRSDTGRWLREWRIACVSKITVILFPKTDSRIPKPRPV